MTTGAPISQAISMPVKNDPANKYEMVKKAIVHKFKAVMRDQTF